MKTYFVVLQIVAFLYLCEACSGNEDNTDEIRVDSVGMIVLRVPAVDVDFETRAKSVEEVGLKEIWVFEGHDVLAHQRLGDDGYGSIKIEMRYGIHNLCIVASSGDGQGWNEDEWVCDRIRETFARSVEVDVRGGELNNVDVVLKRRTAKVMWTVEDVIPDDVQKVKVWVETCHGVTAGMVGTGKDVYQNEADVTEKVGREGYNPSVVVMTEKVDEVENVRACIEFVGMNGETVVKYEDDVPVKSNRVTNVHGRFFSDGGMVVVTVDDEWEHQEDVGLFE